MVRVEALSKRIKALIKDTERTKAGNGSDQKYESAQMQSEKIKEILERYSGIISKILRKQTQFNK